MLYGVGFMVNEDLYQTVVLILIFLENALRLRMNMLTFDGELSLNPYFFGKCSTALKVRFVSVEETKS